MATGKLAPGYGMLQRDVMTMKISVYSKAVYGLLISYAGAKDVCYPSLNTISEDLNISKPTVIKAIKELQEVDLVLVTKTKKTNKDFDNNIYEPLYILGGGVVKEVYQGSKGDLLGVVKEVYSKNNNIRNNNKEYINLNDNSKKELSLYQLMVEFWLKELHPGWTFTGQSGKSMKSLITKTKKILKDAGRDFCDAEVLSFFKLMCQNLPEWYAQKDISTIDSKFNEIITEIKQRKNGTQTTKDVGQQYRKTI